MNSVGIRVDSVAIDKTLASLTVCELQRNTFLLEGRCQMLIRNRYHNVWQQVLLRLHCGTQIVLISTNVICPNSKYNQNKRMLVNIQSVQVDQFAKSGILREEFHKYFLVPANGTFTALANQHQVAVKWYVKTYGAYLHN